MKAPKPRKPTQFTSSSEPGVLVKRAYLHLNQSLVRFLARRTSNRNDADDVAQEVYLRLLRMSQPERVRQPQAYVYRVATNVLREFRHRESRATASQEQGSAQDELIDIIDASPSAEELFDQKRIAVRLAKMIDRLTPMQKAVLVLVTQQDLSHAEVAATLGISVNTVRVHLHRAISFCRQNSAFDDFK